MLSGLSGLSGLSAVCGGAAAAGPTAPAGAVFAVVAHPSFCRSDAACTVPCAAGDAIRWWKELVTGTWYEQATSGYRLILREDATGWYVEHAETRFHAFSLTELSAPVTVFEDAKFVEGNSNAARASSLLPIGALSNIPDVGTTDAGIPFILNSYCLYGGVAHITGSGGDGSVVSDAKVPSSTHTYGSGITWRSDTGVVATSASSAVPNGPPSAVVVGMNGRKSRDYQSNNVRGVALFTGAVPVIADVVQHIKSWRGM